MTTVRFVFAVLLLSVLLGVGFRSVLSQGSGNPGDLPTPEVVVDFRAGDESQLPTDGVHATVVASVPIELKCECGAIFEVKLQEASEWLVLGMVAPEEAGDANQQYQWAIATNIFERDKKYDVRVSLFDRQGNESSDSLKSFEMKPIQENDCSNGEFANVIKTAGGTNEHPVLSIFWDKVCKEGRQATRYVVKKNGQTIREPDGNTPYLILEAQPNNDTWRIEAYGEEPPDQNNAVIRNCDEVVRKLNARLNARPTITPAVRIASLLQCQQIDGLLRTIIEWEPYTHCAVSCNYVSPDFWSFYSAFTPPPNQGHWQPLFNYPTPSSPASFWWPGPPGPGSWELLKMGWRCRKVGATVDNGNNGFNSDPMNQVGWTCPGTWTNGELGPNSVYRQWVNFDLINSPTPPSIWPVTTEFTY